MTEAEAVAAVREQAERDGGSKGLQSSARMIGQDFPDDTIRKRYLGCWYVGFDHGHSFYTVNNETGKVGFVLILGGH